MSGYGVEQCSYGEGGNALAGVPVTIETIGIAPCLFPSNVRPSDAQIEKFDTYMILCFRYDIENDDSIRCLDIHNIFNVRDMTMLNYRCFEFENQDRQTLLISQIFEIIRIAGLKRVVVLSRFSSSEERISREVLNLRYFNTKQMILGIFNANRLTTKMRELNYAGSVSVDVFAEQIEGTVENRFLINCLNSLMNIFGRIVTISSFRKILRKQNGNVSLFQAFVNLDKCNITFFHWSLFYLLFSNNDSYDIIAIRDQFIQYSTTDNMFAMRNGSCFYCAYSIEKTFSKFVRLGGVWKNATLEITNYHNPSFLQSVDDQFEFEISNNCCVENTGHTLLLRCLNTPLYDVIRLRTREIVMRLIRSTVFKIGSCYTAFQWKCLHNTLRRREWNRDNIHCLFNIFLLLDPSSVGDNQERLRELLDSGTTFKDLDRILDDKNYPNSYDYSILLSKIQDFWPGLNINYELLPHAGNTIYGTTVYAPVNYVYTSNAYLDMHNEGNGIMRYDYF